MIVKQLVDEDFTNYKKPSMFIGFPQCDWKCERECGKKMCQNKELATSKDINISFENIISRYINNPISKAIIFGGLEPFNSWNEMVNLIHKFREKTDDDIVIYTGFYLFEINDKIEYLRQNYDNIIVKFGRFVPNQNPHFDEILGINLASDNQYAERIS